MISAGLRGEWRKRLLTDCCLGPRRRRAKPIVRGVPGQVRWSDHGVVDERAARAHLGQCTGRSSIWGSNAPKKLEAENVRLKRILADPARDTDRSRANTSTTFGQLIKGVNADEFHHAPRLA